MQVIGRASPPLLEGGSRETVEEEIKTQGGDVGADDFPKWMLQFQCASHTFTTNEPT